MKRSETACLVQSAERPATEGSWIIEDDYDSEYRYFGRPLAALQSLDRGGCVIYVGTFTKMLFNALRLGFLALPAHLVEPFAVARTLTDRHPPTLDQAILAEFILDGHFGHHVRRMRQIYAERMEALCDAANQRLGGHAARGKICLGNTHHSVAEDRRKGYCGSRTRASARSGSHGPLTVFTAPLSPRSFGSWVCGLYSG